MIRRAPYWSLILPDGSEYPLTAEQGITVQQAQGVGMPPITNTVNEYAILDGASFQRSRANSRLIQFLITVQGKSHRSSYFQLRAALINAVNPHRLDVPVQLRYYGYDGLRWANVYYDAGLELGTEVAGSEQFTLRLLAPDPFFYAESLTETLVVADLIDTVSTSAILRSQNGLWDNMGDASGDVYAIVPAPGGGCYIGGDFLVAGGVACNRVAYWDGTTFSPLGAGVDNTVYALALAANGDLYVGGIFLNAGGAPAVRIAMWDGAAWNALGAGLDGTCRCIAIMPSGNVYAGGAFNNAGGGAAAKVAAWNGAAWSALGAGLNNTCQALALTQSGLLYAAGMFNTAGGAAANYVAVWDIAAATWSPLGAGTSATVNAMILARDGTIYVGGTFQTAGGVTCNQLAHWTGAAWEPLGEGTEWPAGSVLALLERQDGFIIAAGGFNYLGGNWSPRVGLWNGYSWVNDGIALTSALADYPYALAQDLADPDILYYGGSFSPLGVPTAFAVNAQITVNNPGNARAHPVFTLYFPPNLIGQTARPMLIRNETNGKTIWLNLAMLQGETLTIDTRPGQRAAYSDFRGLWIGNNPLPGSQLSTFVLEPGDNVLSLLVDDISLAGIATGTLTFAPRYWGID